MHYNDSDTYRIALAPRWGGGQSGSALLAEGLNDSRLSLETLGALMKLGNGDSTMRYGSVAIVDRLKGDRQQAAEVVAELETAGYITIHQIQDTTEEDPADEPIEVRRVDNSGATAISGATLQDDRLSFTALGVLAHCLSLPEGTQLEAGRVASGRPDDVTAVESAFQELTAAGYFTDETGEVT